MEVNTENEALKGEIGTPRNICRAMCKVVDRFSIILSLIVLVTTPIIFQLIYNGTIHFDCRTYPENWVFFVEMLILFLEIELTIFTFISLDL